MRKISLVLIVALLMNTLLAFPSSAGIITSQEDVVLSTIEQREGTFL